MNSILWWVLWTAYMLTVTALLVVAHRWVMRKCMEWYWEANRLSRPEDDEDDRPSADGATA